MDEQTEVKKVSPTYEAFLNAIEQNGAYVQVLESEPGKDKKIAYYNIKKGSKNHGITDEMLVGFRPLTRKEQRAIFHTPYKFGRRVKA